MPVVLRPAGLGRVGLTQFQQYPLQGGIVGIDAGRGLRFIE